MRYDPEQTAWMVKPPAWEGWPASTGDVGFLPFAVSIGAGVLSIGVLHGVGLAARLSFGLQVSMFLGVAGLIFAGLTCTGEKEFVARAVAGFLSGPFYGSVFGFGLALAVVCGFQAEARKWASARLPFCIAVAGNAAGLLFFAPPLLAAAYLLPVVLFVVFGLVYLSRTGSMGGIARSSVMFLFGGALAVCLLLAAAPEDVFAAKSQGMDIQLAFPELYRQLEEALSRISHAIWRDTPWCGAGIGAFGLYVPFVAEKADWSILPPTVSVAFNGYWTILAERGILGCVALLGGLGLLLVVWILRLIRAILFLKTRDDADTFVFACAPVVWIAPFLLVIFCLEAFFTSVFNMSVVLLPVVSSIALSAASFPKNPETKMVQAKTDEEN